MDYKRLLIVNMQSIYKNNATGITMRSIFGGWPTEKALEVCLDESFEVGTDLGIKSVSAGGCFPIRRLMMSKRDVIKRDSLTASENKSPLSIFKSKLRRFLINFADVSFMKRQKAVESEIDAFKPEVIYTLGASAAVMKLAVRTARRRNIPIVLHFMDDWPHYLQDNKGLGQYIYKKTLHRWLKKCRKLANINLAISPQMAECYEKETGIKHTVMMNSVDVKGLYCEKPEKSDCFYFTYAGGLHLNRWRALKEVESAIETVGAELKRQVKLRIYTKLENTEELRQRFNPETTEFYGFVPHSRIKEVYESSNALVHIEVLSPLLIGYFRFSISTKIPEYLSSNRPMLFYGPDNIGLYRYLSDNKCAFVSSDFEGLKQQIMTVLNDTEAVEAVLKNALKTAESNHEIKNNREIFVSVTKVDIK